MTSNASEPIAITPESLENLVLNGEPQDIAAAFKSVTEKERKKLSKTASTLYKTIRRRGLGQLVADSLKGLAKRVATGKAPSLDINAQLMLLAVCPLSIVKRMDLWHMKRQGQDAMVQILGDRRPDWLDAWIEHQLEQQFVGISWKSLRTLIKSGICAKPKGAGYIRLMASHFYTWQHYGKEKLIPLSKRLLEDPELLEGDVYRLFEVETTAFAATNYDAHPPAPAGFETWIAALGILSSHGHIDRQRLLDASLKGLSSGLREIQLTGFRKAHVHFDPSLVEIKSREPEYRDLLQLRVGHVVSFTLKMLSKLEKSKQLDGAAFLEALGPVFALKTKGPAKTALKASKRLFARYPELASQVEKLAIQALQHEASDIQEIAIDLLEAKGGTDHVLFAEELSRLVPSLAPSLQTRALGLCPSSLIHVKAEIADDTEWFDGLWDRLKNVPASLRKTMGLDADALLNAFPPPLDYDILDAPVLSGVAPIVPIKNLEELIDAVSHAVEIVDSADEVERILDGLSRLCDQKPTQFTALTAPLLKRLKTREHAEVFRGLTSNWGGISLAFHDLLLTWLTGDFHETSDRLYFVKTHAFLFTIRRIVEVKKRIYKKKAGPLLAAPTHAQGWIDPRLFIGRLNGLSMDWLSTHREDITQALLRLAPDGRPEALQLAQNLKGKLGRLVRWTLGAAEGPIGSDKHDYELWVSAGRARSPRKPLRASFVVFPFIDDLPDGQQPANYHWQSTVRTTTSYNKKEYNHPNVEVSHGCGGFGHYKHPTARGMAAWKGMASNMISIFKRIVSLPALPSWKKIPTSAMHYPTKYSWQTYDLSGTWSIQ